jgi:glyoxylase-like metal-dependent hydrolase (beta-lactamase superfamily II)
MLFGVNSFFYWYIPKSYKADPMNRRNFLKCSSSCGAFMFGLSQFAPIAFRSMLTGVSQDREIVATEKWGRIEKIEEGAWAVISTPFSKDGDFTTVCNGGIIAGDKGVLAIESFMTPKGATWLAKAANEMTGRWPTDVVSTHFHGDHTAGHSGYFVDGHAPNIWLTDATAKAAEASFEQRGMQDNAFKNLNKVDAKNGYELDLGNRKVNIKPHSGHTSSDVTIELVDPKVIWTGDLFFNRMFPNYGDAIPSKLSTYVEEIKQAKETTVIPGHGPVADTDAINKYSDFLAWIEAWSKDSIQKKESIDDATADFKLPKEFADWIVWSPDNAKKAWSAWNRELNAEKKKKAASDAAK